MSEDEWDLVLVAEIDGTVPGEDVLDARDDVPAKRFESFEEGLRICVEVSVEQDFALLVDDADGHGPGVQVDAAVEGVGVLLAA